jgi:hypothetical protein
MCRLIVLGAVLPVVPIAAGQGSDEAGVVAAALRSNSGLHPGDNSRVPSALIDLPVEI